MDDIDRIIQVLNEKIARCNEQLRTVDEVYLARIAGYKRGLQSARDLLVEIMRIERGI